MFQVSGSTLPIPTARPFHRITTDRRLYDLVTSLATMGGWQQPDIRVAPLVLLNFSKELGYLATRYPLDRNALTEAFGRELSPSEGWAHNIEWLCKEYLNHVLEAAQFTLPYEQSEPLPDYDRRLFVQACNAWSQAQALKEKGKELEFKIVKAAVGVICEELARKHELGELRPNAAEDMAKYQSRIAKHNPQRWAASVYYVSGHFFGDRPL